MLSKVKIVIRKGLHWTLCDFGKSTDIWESRAKWESQTQGLNGKHTKGINGNHTQGLNGNQNLRLEEISQGL